MSRQPRLEFPGAFYHVMARGHRREYLFEKEEIKLLMIRTLKEAAIRFGWKIHAYAIMDNHYHLLLETPGGNLVVGMSWFQTTFTVRCNRHNGQCGHVFAGRYKSVLVQSKKGPYLSQLISYIHLNPTRAGIYPGRDEDFSHAHRWTSLYWLTKEGGQCPAWYTTERFIPKHPQREETQGRVDYLKRLEVQARREQLRAGEGVESLLETKDISLRRGWVYGDMAFREEMKHLMESQSPVLPAGVSDTEKAEVYIRQAKQAFELTKEELLAKKKGAPEKIAIGMLLKERTGLNHRDVASLLNMGHHVRSARLINEALKKKGVDSPITRCYEKIILKGKKV